jgi:hypothetical protein
MLKGLNTSGRYLQVTGGNSNTHISKSYNSNVHSQGDMRYDLDDQTMKVFDGTSWQTLHGSYATVEMTYEAESLLDWARKKRQEEMELEVLAKEHPSIKDLVDQINLKKEQIKMVKTLVQSPGNDTIKPSMVP